MSLSRSLFNKPIRYSFSGILGAALMMGLFAWPTNGSSGIPSNERTPEGGTVMDSKVALAGTNFGLDLYRQLARSKSSGNIFISPSSIALCLTMAYNGAGGDTARAIAEALRINDIPLGVVNKAYSDWRKSLLQPGSRVQLEIANSLWVKRGISFLPEFLDLNRSFYEAEVTDLNFKDPGTPSTINSWVSRKTKGKIPKIIDQIDSNSILFLINAIYFKGKWEHQFDKKQTKDGPFTTSSGSTIQRPLMRRSGSFLYFEGEGLQSVQLPYGDGRISMYVFLPAKETSLSAFQNHLSESWQSWMSRYDEADGEVVLPRFRIEYETELNDPLKALGMGLAFDEQRADFSRMLHSSQNVFISKVKHKAFADVDEEGTEAAAATSTEIQVVSMVMPKKRFQMVVDRPFFFAIRDNESGALLFLGSVGQIS